MANDALRYIDLADWAPAFAGEQDVNERSIPLFLGLHHAARSALAITRGTASRSRPNPAKIRSGKQKGRPRRDALSYLI